MSDELPNELTALYRSSATDEPDAELDAAILRAARRNRRPRLMIAAATLLLAAATTTIALRPEKPVHPAPLSAQASMPAGMADGRGRFLAASDQPQRIGMNERPMSAND